MFELRWHIRGDWRFLQFRQRTNILEIGIQEPIWSEWKDIEVVIEEKKEISIEEMDERLRLAGEVQREKFRYGWIAVLKDYFNGKKNV